MSANSLTSPPPSPGQFSSPLSKRRNERSTPTSDRFIPNRMSTKLDDAMSTRTDVSSTPAEKSRPLSSNQIAMNNILKFELLGQPPSPRLHENENSGLKVSVSNTTGANIFKFACSSPNPKRSSDVCVSHFRSPLASSSSPPNSVVCSSGSNIKPLRKISKIPFKILNAPTLQDDFYLNLVDWSSTNLLTVALSSSVYTWSANTSRVTKLCDLSSLPVVDSVSSVCWSPQGDRLAIGTNLGSIQIWDVSSGKHVCDLVSHGSRVGTIAWGPTLLASGSRDKRVLVQDMRIRCAASTDSVNSAASSSGAVSGSSVPFGRREHRRWSGGSVPESRQGQGHGQAAGHAARGSRSVQRLSLDLPLRPAPAHLADTPATSLTSDLMIPLERINRSLFRMDDDPATATAIAQGDNDPDAGLDESLAPHRGVPVDATEPTSDDSVVDNSEAMQGVDFLEYIASAGASSLFRDSVLSSYDIPSGRHNDITSDSLSLLDTRQPPVEMSTREDSSASVLSWFTDPHMYSRQDRASMGDRPLLSTFAALQSAITARESVRDLFRVPLHSSLDQNRPPLPPSAPIVFRTAGVVQDIRAHKQEVCGLKWSFDEKLLASGGNDNKLHVWSMAQPATTGADGSSVPMMSFSEHTAAVKAVAWSPHQHGLLASGGGTADRHIRFWNTQTGQSLHSIDTGSQTCNLLWSKNVNEIVSTHGYSLNQVVVWKYPSMSKIATLTGHTMRVLYLAASPDGHSIVTGAGDESLRFWNIFPTGRHSWDGPSTGALAPTCSDIR